MAKASTIKKTARGPKKPTLASLGLVEQFSTIDYEFAEASTIEIPARTEQVGGLTADNLRTISLDALDRAAAAEKEQRDFDKLSWQWAHFETIKRRMTYIAYACHTLAETMDEQSDRGA